MSQMRPPSSSGGIASLMVHGKDGAISVISQDGSLSPRGAMEADLSGDFMEQYGMDGDRHHVYHPQEKFAHELGKGNGDPGDLQSLQDELRQIQDERKALLRKTNSLAGIPEEPKHRGEGFQGRQRQHSQGGGSRQQQHAGRARSAGSGGRHHHPSPSHQAPPASSGSPYAPQQAQLDARRLSDPAEQQPAKNRRPQPASPSGRPDSSEGANRDAEEELRRRLLTEVTDAIEAAFAAEVAAVAAAQQQQGSSGGKEAEGKGGKAKGGKGTAANKKPSRSDVESVARFAVKAAQLQVASAQEDLEKRAKEKRAKAVASAEARAEERLSDAVKSGREAREAAAASTAGLQQARAEADKLRAERRSLTERVERWRKERDVAVEKESEMAMQLEEAQRKERTAAKEASKATKRANKANEEVERLRTELGTVTEELQAAREHHEKSREQHRTELEEAATERRAALDAQRKELLATQQERVDDAIAEVIAATKDNHNFCKVELSALEAAMQEQLQEAAAALEGAMAEQAEGALAFQAEVQAVRASLAEAAAEVEAEAAKGREAVARELEAVVRPGGKDPRELALEAEELRCELRELMAENGNLREKCEALEAERTSVAESLGAEAEHSRALGKQLKAKERDIEALQAEGKALLQRNAAKDEELQVAEIRDKQRLQTIAALEQQREIAKDELESTKQRLQQQLSIVADKSLMAAKLEGQIEGVQSKMAKELQNAHVAAGETLKALQALRRKYFEVKAEQPRKLQKVPSSKGGGAAAGFGSSSAKRGDSAMQRRNSSNSRKGPQEAEEGGLALPGGRDSEPGGWLSVKLTERGIDPALREWSKRVASAWEGPKGTEEQEQEELALQSEQQILSSRAAAIQREILRLEGAMLLSLQEAIREPPAPVAASPPAKAASSPANAPLKPAAPSRSPSSKAQAAPSASRGSSRTGAAPEAAKTGEEDPPSMLEKRLRGARERVERIRGEVEDGALKTYSAMDTAMSNPPGAMEGLIRRRSECSSTDISPKGPGASFAHHPPPEALTGEAEEEVMAVLDMLGRASINAAPGGGHHGANNANQSPPDPEAAAEGHCQQPPGSISRTSRPVSASSYARLERELGYGGVGLGLSNASPEWQH